MRIPIFHKQNKNTYKEEYYKILKVLTNKCIAYEKKEYNYFEFINTHLFHRWKYRDTFLDCYSYLKSIGINITHPNKIHEESFLNFLEFLLNIQLLLESIKKYRSVIFSDKASSILFHNIPLILDSMDYGIYEIDDKVYILKKNIMYENLMELVPNDSYELLMSYPLLSNNGIKMKRIILNKIYEKIGDYKTYNPSLYMSIKLVVTKMGIIGEIDKKYKGLSSYKLRKYYDYCFQMMCYLVESKTINHYKEEIKGE